MKRYIRSASKFEIGQVEIGQYNAADPRQARMVEDLRTEDVTRFGNAYKADLYRLTQAFQTLKPQYDEVCTALKNIFSQYGLEVTDEFITFTVYPPGWPWPYKYCKSIQFGEFGIEQSNLLVPASYLDGVNTKLPQSVIDKAVKACERPLAIMNDYATSWPTSWPDGYLNNKFIDKFTRYSRNIVNSVNDEYGLYIDEYALPTPSSPIAFKTNSSGEVIFEMKYSAFLKTMRELATSSTTRDEFEQKYRVFIEEHI